MNPETIDEWAIYQKQKNSFLDITCAEKKEAVIKIV